MQLDAHAEVAKIVLEHWVQTWEHPTWASAVRCMKPGCTWEGNFPGDISQHVADILLNQFTITPKDATK